MSHEVSRRTLLALGGASAALALTPSRALADKKKHPQVPRRVLGKTKQKIPILLVGGAAGFKSSFDSKISVAYRHGANYIDTARVYAGGRSEPHAANTIHKMKVRKNIWITSKSPNWDAKRFAADVDKTLKLMRTSYIDLYYLHALDDMAPLNDKALIQTAERLKKEGKIKYFGFSCHSGNVVELLQASASRSFIDSVMFRYNFRQYGNKELNKAMDAAHKAGVGLIAMKTQGSEASFRDAWKKFEKTGKWNKHQAVLKAVWADDRIAAAVSHMDTLKKVKENVAAALDGKKLGAADEAALERYARATRSEACDGCDHLCGAAVDAPVQIADTMRFLMYHDQYGERAKARALFQALPAEARPVAGLDFTRANRACPHGVDVAAHMKRALRVLA